MKNSEDIYEEEFSDPNEDFDVNMDDDEEITRFQKVLSVFGNFLKCNMTLFVYFAIIFGAAQVMQTS